MRKPKFKGKIKVTLWYCKCILKGWVRHLFAEELSKEVELRNQKILDKIEKSEYKSYYTMDYILDELSGPEPEQNIKKSMLHTLGKKFKVWIKPTEHNKL